MDQVAIQQGILEYNSISADTAAERRHLRLERRVNKRKAAVQTIYRRRRQSVRRNTDNLSNIYVDTHERKLWYLATGLMVLCVLDAFFTTILIRHGSEELNPLMNFLLQVDLGLFLAAKFFITGFSISFLVMHKHHRLLNTVNCYQILIASVVAYSVLVAYEFSMIRYIPDLI